MANGIVDSENKEKPTQIITESEATKPIDELLNEAFEIRVKDVENSILKGIKALEMSLEINDISRISRAKNYLALFYMITGQNTEAIKYAQEAINYYRATPNTKEEAFGLYTLGSVYYKTANHEMGLEFLFASLRIWEVVGDRANESRTLKAIGYIYEIFDDYENAKKNYLKCLEISNEIGDKNGESNACNPLSGIYLNQGKLDEAHELIERSIRLKEETGDLRGMAFAFYGKGKLLFRKKKFEEAKKYIVKSLHIHIEMGESLGEGLARQKLGKLNIAQGDYKEAQINTKMALDIGEAYKNHDLIYEALYQLYTIAKDLNKTTQALKYFERYHEVRERVLSIEISGKIKSRESLYLAEMSKKEAVIERLKNIELKIAHDEIEAQNLEITQSIKYAQRIQKAILPSTLRWESEFPDSFALYIPKDHVSGDFYWLKKKGSKTLFSVIDCTGHGVPGSLVSMVGYNGLNQLVDRLNLTKPNTILDNLCRFIKIAFKSEELDIQDGMDMALCCFNKDNFTLQYAGANNPIFLVRQGELTVYKADKQPIGNYSDLTPFKNTNIALEDGDRVYLMTDGFADQFGGPDLKKFKTRSLKELILEIQNLPMQEQIEVLETSFREWQGDYFQIDDVCLVGIEFRK